MTFAWLKSLMPRSLFARSLLILLFPVILLQLIVGMVFIQRHFEKVTTQMARPVAVELNYIADLIDNSPNLVVATTLISTFERPFGMRYTLDPDATFSPVFRRFFYDLSGKALIAGFQNDLTHGMSVNLTDDPRSVLIDIQTNKGVLSAAFSRNRVSASNPHQLLVLMIFASIILTIISVLFLRNQVRPIRELARASEAFGMGRNENYRPSGAIEVRRAGYAFLTMRARLEKQIEQRTQMLSGVSHDLRTPLTRMKLSLAMMDESEGVTELENDVADMETMLQLFLEFARQDSVEETKQVDPNMMMQELVDNARRTGQTIEYEYRADPNTVKYLVIRPSAIKRAVMNLISNAAKYGTKCALTVHLSKTAFKITVEDNGPSIPESERQNALQPFVRLDPARNQEKAGVGLGLAIAADVVHSHGGSLELSDSESMGGLKVVFSIPV